ncbi:hypothetical protein AVEN_131936-1 [Araneus ventricosus]|uniref:Uncharacterized protein n=1 Tax=Araneus ventricosus TaxID=182803 RepID=A0A4Y2B3Z9_ARAVE|nr:hypothetical protein AVEN_131936-1 [Araneus ventricosus]
MISKPPLSPAPLGGWGTSIPPLFFPPEKQHPPITAMNSRKSFLRVKCKHGHKKPSVRPKPDADERTLRKSSVSEDPLDTAPHIGGLAELKDQELRRGEA